MNTKLQFYQAVADRTLGDLTARSGNWLRFLDTAARLYKYPFYDQMMIYAQKPDAAACAELELWNEQFNRWVRRGSKGIALIDDSGSYPRLKYVFDVSDTEPSLYHARPVKLWEMRQEHKAAVISELAKNYEDIDADGTLADAFGSIAEQLSCEYYEDNHREIAFRSENSALEPQFYDDGSGMPYEQADDAALKAEFISAVTASVAYSVMTRCGLDTSEYFDEDDFRHVTDFNTPDMVHALGVASAELSSQVLRDIEITIRKYERLKNASVVLASQEHERSEQNYDRNPYLHSEGRLPSPEHHVNRAADERTESVPGISGAGTLGQNEESVPERTQENILQPSANLGEVVPAPAGRGRGGESEIRTDNVVADGANQLARQSEGAGVMDCGDEHAESAGDGSNTQRTDLRVEQTETRSLEEILSTSPISIDEVDSILRDGGNFDSHKLHDVPYNSRSSLRIAAHFSRGLDDNAKWLKREYLTGLHGRDFHESGKGFVFAGELGAGNHSVCAWFDEEGVNLAIGTTAKNNIHKVTIPWEVAATRIDELMRDGRYIGGQLLNAAYDTQRRELASALWFFYRDDMQKIPDEWRAPHGGYPEDVALVAKQLSDSDLCVDILDRLEADVNRFISNGGRTWHNPKRLLADMRAYMQPVVIKTDGREIDGRDFNYFITQDEIDALLTHGGVYTEGKMRFLSFLLHDHDANEKIEFFKREYGHGGGTWSYTNGWHNAEPGKGVKIQRGNTGNPDAETELKWPAVIKRTEQLIADGLYMTRAELDRIPNYERLILVRQINNFYYGLPDEYKRPFPGKSGIYPNEYRDENGSKILDFHYPHEAEWEAIRALLDDSERLETILSQMRYIFENTSANDRHYDSRKAAYEHLSAFMDGTYTLFPGIENIPEPGSVSGRNAKNMIGSDISRLRSVTPNRETVEDLRESPSNGLPFGEPLRGEQMSFFPTYEPSFRGDAIFGAAQDSPLPILTSVDEQRTKIDETLQEEAAEIQAASFLERDNIDKVLMDISVSEKAAIAEQFNEDPRSRDAVNLIKEIYGNTLTIPLPQAVKRIEELVTNGAFVTPNPYSVFEQVREELSKRGYAVSGELIEEAINDYNTVNGGGSFSGLADFIEREYLTEETEFEYETGVSEQQEQTRHYQVGDTSEIVPEPEPGEKSESESAQNTAELDFDAIAQTVYNRVMADENYAYHLQFAQNRGALRNPLNMVLGKVIAEMREAEPALYGDYFDDDISDDLFTFVYRRSWESRQTPRAVIEQPVQSEVPSAETDNPLNSRPFPQTEAPEEFTEATDQAAIAESNRVFDGWEQAESEPKAEPILKPVQNFRITDDHLGEGGAKSKFRNNIKALQTLKNIELEGRLATIEEQETLSRYIGWGGLPQAFDPNNKDWANEYLELNTLLTPEEYASARASTLNAHYTSPVVIKAIWDTMERIGFKSGNILEPSMGVGNFFGLLPERMRGSKLYGVELDSVTARIAAQLYPKASIQQTGFEKTEFSDAFFDLAIGNVPFGEYGVADKRYDKHNFSIHNYFFAKALDKVRPGGVVAFITSKYTMDSRDPSVRKYLAQRAELLGAVRLPNNAFLKNAGTETTMDILFLKKRDRPLDIESGRMGEHFPAGTSAPDWVHLGLTAGGIPANRYFLDNPETVCGVMGLDKRMNDKYGRDDVTACLPIEGADLGEQLKSAMLSVQGTYEVEELDDLDGVDNHAIPADNSVKNFSYAVVDDKVYFRENSLMYPVDLPATTLERIKGMIGLRTCVQELISLQLDDYTDESEIKEQQQKLNDLYDSFAAEFGLISSQANNRAFNADSAYYLLSSLEILNEDGELERKADMFTKRTIKQKTVITHVDTASEALAVSIGEKGSVDLDYMSELTGFDREKLLEDLRGVVFLNVGLAESQEKTYVTADEYLSGNVRDKLKLAEAAALSIPSLAANAEALKAVQPKDLEAGEIAVRLGATWIEPKYVQEFMYELLNTSYYNKRIYQVQYHAYTGEWQVAGKGRSLFSDIPSTVTYGTSRMNAYQILDDTLNLRDVRVYDYKEDADGKERRVLNKKETMLAQQKQDAIKQAFK